MLELLANRCFGRNQTPYLIKDITSIKDVFERERDVSQLKPGDNIYITARTVKMVDSHLINKTKPQTELVWVKDVVADGSDFILEVGGNKMLSTFNFKKQWINLLSNKTKPSPAKIENYWPHITERSMDPTNMGFKMIGWEPPKIEDYRVISPTLFHYSDPLFQEKQDIREAAYLQSVASYNTRVNNYYQVLAQACIMGKVAAFNLKNEQIIKLASMTCSNDHEDTISLQNMITGNIHTYNFMKDIEIYQAYIMHDHFVIHANVGLITSRNMEELFET